MRGVRMLLAWMVLGTAVWAFVPVHGLALSDPTPGDRTTAVELSPVDAPAAVVVSEPARRSARTPHWEPALPAAVVAVAALVLTGVAPSVKRSSPHLLHWSSPIRHRGPPVAGAAA